MIKPMLAHKFDKSRVDWNEPVYMQPKLDGVRCLIYLDRKTPFHAQHIVAKSRTDKEFMNLDHIKKDLMTLFDDQPSIVLDGELYNHELRNDFEQIISLVRKQKPTIDDRKRAKKLIQYHVYDYMWNDELNPEHIQLFNKLDYKERMDNLTCADFYTKSIQPVETHRIRFLDEAKTTHQLNLRHGYEGSILRLNKPYKFGRSYGLMKFKDFSDTEATIVGYEEGKGKRQGTIGKFLMQDDEGIKFGCPPGKGYTYKDLANMLLNVHDYIGQRATFTYFQRTNAGSYRHPLFKCVRNYE
jgi:DNA ligase 1